MSKFTYLTYPVSPALRLTPQIKTVTSVNEMQLKSMISRPHFYQDGFTGIKSRFKF